MFRVVIMQNVAVYFLYIITALPQRSQAVARIADRTAKNCRGHVT